jgi:hypothetical protein
MFKFYLSLRTLDDWLKASANAGIDPTAETIQALRTIEHAV